jgi:hypothetical protein
MTSQAGEQREQSVTDVMSEQIKQKSKAMKRQRYKAKTPTDPSKGKEIGQR